MMKYFFLVLCIYSLVSFSSCKKGCTDPKARNYKEDNQVENGTCVYCDTVNVFDQIDFILTDFNSTAPQDNVLKFIATQNDTLTLGNGCKSIGIEPVSNCSKSLSVINITGKRIVGEVRIRFFLNSNVAEWSYDAEFNIFSGDTINFGVVDSFSCSDIDEGFFNLSNSQLQYF